MMIKHVRRAPAAPHILILLLALAAVLVHVPQVQGLTWNSPEKIGMDSLSSDTSLKFVDAAPPAGTLLKTDTKVKFVDANSNSAWNTGETVVYDSNINGRYDALEPVIAGSTPAGSTSLNPDAKVKLVDTNGDNLWESGEAVVYDSNNSNTYDSAEPVVAGSAPAPGSLNSDSRVKYLDTNGNNLWNSGESVVYETNPTPNNSYDASLDPKIKYVDSNNSNTWNALETLVYDTDNNNVFNGGDQALTGLAPPTGTPLKSDPKLKFVDANRNGAWTSGEAVVYDSNGNGYLDSAEIVVVGARPPYSTPLTSDPSPFRIRYGDSNNSSSWEAGESVVYETIVNGYYNASRDTKVKFVDGTNQNGRWDSGESVVYDRDSNGIYTVGDNVIAPPNPVLGDSMLSPDPLFRIVDGNRNGLWDLGETVAYDTNGNNIYDTGEASFGGTIPPGTLLSEPVIAGATPAIGTFLKIDSRIRFVDTTGTGSWDQGEAVIYDNDSNGSFDINEQVVAGGSPPSGTILGEPLIAGQLPAPGSVLKLDTKIRFSDPNLDLVWDQGEVVAYDSNANNLYETGEPVMAGAAAGTNALWDPGEVVAYDSNNDSIYNTGDSPVAGSAPVNNTRLRTDAKVRYLDDNINGRRDPGETVVYDTNSNSQYDQGEPVIAGSTPTLKLAEWPSAAPDFLARVWLVWNEKTIGSSQNPDLYLRLWTGSTWTTKQQVTSDPAIDDSNFVLPLLNQTMMIIWSSNRTGNRELFYKMYTGSGTPPSPTTGERQLTFNLMHDRSPSAFQDMYGRIWVAWARQSSAGTTVDIYYKYYNGSAWSSDFAVPAASGPGLGESSPWMGQTKEGQVRVVWASNDTGNLRLYTTQTDGRMDSLPSTGIPVSSWSLKRLLWSTVDDDDRPVLLQVRDGVLWIFFQRTPSSGSTGASIYHSSSSDAGANWSPPAAFTSETDSNPSAAQMGDNRIWVFWNRQGVSTDEVWFTKSEPPITSIHDVGVRALKAVPRLIKSGDPNPIRIDVTVRNYGDFQETTQFTLKYNDTTLTTSSLTLTAGETRIVQYDWSTSLGFWGRYLLTSTVQAVSGENTLNQADNTFPGGLVRISPPGDVDGNGIVNIFDAAAVAFAYGTRPGDPLWNPNADVNRSGNIDIFDAAQVAFNYGKSV